MAVVIPHNIIGRISTAENPAQAIMDAAGDLSGLEVMGDRVLVGIYMRPEKTKGGIIRPDSNKEEDVYQGKVGLVLKWGPNAFVNPDNGELCEQTIQPGEWGVFMVGDGRQLQVNGLPCRMVKDISFIAKVKDPLMVL